MHTGSRRRSSSGGRWTHRSAPTVELRQKTPIISSSSAIDGRRQGPPIYVSRPASLPYMTRLMAWSDFWWRQGLWPDRPSLPMSTFDQAATIERERERSRRLIFTCICGGLSQVVQLSVSVQVSICPFFHCRCLGVIFIVWFVLLAIFLGSLYLVPSPWVAAENDPTSFFQTGTTMFNSIDLNGATEKGDFRVSYTNLNQPY